MHSAFPNAADLCNTLSSIYNLRLNLAKAESEREDLENEYPYISPTGTIHFSQLQKYNTHLEDIKNKDYEITQLKKRLSELIESVKKFIPEEMRNREFSVNDDRRKFVYFLDNGDELIIRSSTYN